VRVPFKGLLYADAATGALVHVQIECVDIPRQCLPLFGRADEVGADKQPA